MANPDAGDTAMIAGGGDGGFGGKGPSPGPGHVLIQLEPRGRLVGPVSGGFYAEYACVDAGLVAPIPDGMNTSQAAVMGGVGIAIAIG